MITKLASLAREIREVIPGTESVTVYETGNVLVTVTTDEHVRSFATAIGKKAGEVEALEVHWLECKADLGDNLLTVAGPTRADEQEAA